MKLSRPLLAASVATVALLGTACAEEPAATESVDADAKQDASLEVAQADTQTNQAANQPAMNAEAKTETAPMSEKEYMQIISYSIGQQMAQFINQNNPDADRESVKAGLEDGLANAEAKYTETQIQQAAEQFQAKMVAEQEAMQAKQEAELAAAAAENEAKSTAFLNANKTKDGVKVTTSGLQYKVITEGEGAKPTATDTVKVHYHGTLPDGKVFDSSVDRGSPIDFPVNGVIQGWQEGLQLMNVGSKYMFYIPSDLAYGNRGAGADIGPGQALVFEVELLEIQ